MPQKSTEARIMDHFQTVNSYIRVLWQLLLAVSWATNRAFGL